MKIAYLINTYPKPSHTFIRREIAALEALGWQVHRFAMRSDRAALVDPVDIIEDNKTEHVLEIGGKRLLCSSLGWMIRHPRHTLAGLAMAIRCGLKGKSGGPGTGGLPRHLIYLIEAAHIARRARKLGLRHIHAHFGTNSATVAMLAEALGGPGFSFTVHGPEEFDAPRGFSFPEKIARARFTVAISSFCRSQLYRWSQIPEWPKIKVVHCGVEIAGYPAPAPMPEGGPHLVAIGRLCEQKGFPVLIETMAIAAKRLPGLTLTICGDGELRSLIESEITRHGIEDRIKIAGWVDETGVRAAIAAAHALILPSLAEGLPMVVIEAMACGRPVISTCINGVPELLTPKEGWLVPAGDATALADAIVELSNTPIDVLAEMGLAARARAMSRHDGNAEAAKLAAHFTEALRSVAVTAHPLHTETVNHA
ncbi:MAG: glycosyltransferase family 4 protein [Cypionkella sp.]|uniref:glycosyltransferase family 4 protein n=1 Tax=Cypionkella sp. TaxID=2811411 RepID=UPI002ABBFD9C|nr:glycosyltransferase family 4 protein [Cypionkella sp.]MDZ4310135.1 glycosyltransferase family 4 protein [Cypionkella sp.]MDZ4394815.1 glycosyltransferase family 4 protein [Cypionkella sp.]